MAFQVALVSDAILQGQRTYHDATTVIATNLTNLNTILAGGNYDLPGNFQLLMSGTNGEIREALSAYAGRRVACRSRHLGAYMCRDGSTYLVAIRGLAAERNCIRQQMFNAKVPETPNTNAIDQISDIIQILEKANNYPSKVTACR